MDASARDENSSTRLSDVTDEDLVVRFQSERCQVAVNELIRRHLQRVRSMAWSMTLNAATADDVTQDVFLRAVRALPDFRRSAKFSTWLHRIAWNVIQDEVARRSSRLAGVDEQAVLEPVAEGQPEQELLQAERSERIEQELERLAPQLRAAIVLTTLQGLTAEEAAELEGCALGTMYWRMHEARRLLRERLKRYLDEGSS